jgi:Ca2+-binding EF-hand superfamily protein
MKRFTITTLGLAAVFASAFAVAQTTDRGMARLDANKDGAVDKTEAAAHPRLAQNFDAIDANKDGKLSSDELRAAREQHKGPDMEGKGGKGEGFAKADVNKDGFIDKAEAANLPRLAKHFDQLDADKDGRVSQAEMQAAHAKRKAS